MSEDRTSGGWLPGLDSLVEWYKKGGVAGSLGMTPVDQQMMEAAAREPVGGSLQQSIRAKMENPLMGWLAPGMIGGMARPVFHGTPHNFEQFSNEAIGSGQGAQTYGFGHYVAGNPETALHYQQTLAGTPEWQYKDPVAGIDSVWGHIRGLDQVKKLPGAEWSTEDLAKYNALKHLNNWRVDFSTGGPPPDMNRMIGDIRGVAPGAADWLEQNKGDFSLYRPGNLLEVHVLPEEHEMLDWDRPMLAQHPDVYQKLKDIYKKKFPNSAASIGPNMSGEEVYQGLAEKLGLGSAEEASRTLHEAGIPGIKYLDQGSRAGPDSSEATRNYVIFDSGNLRVTAKNGVKLTPVDHDPFGGSE